MFKGKPIPKFSFNTVVGYSAFTFDILFCKDPIHLSTYILGYPLIAVIYK